VRHRGPSLFDAAGPAPERRCKCGRSLRKDAELCDFCVVERAAKRPAKFDGATFDQRKDGERLATLQHAVMAYMADALWHTVPEVQRAVGRGTETSIAARIRDCRKERWGNLIVDTRRNDKGLWEYQVLQNNTKEAS